MLSNEDEAILDNIIRLYFFQAAQIYTQIWRNFLLAGAAVRIRMKICIACLHVGQMLFAGNKYLLLKRITVWLGVEPILTNAKKRGLIYLLFLFHA